MAHPMDRQKDILNDIFDQHRIGHLFAHDRPDSRNDSAQKLRISVTIPHLRFYHQRGPCFAWRKNVIHISPCYLPHAFLPEA
ncbi:hypothetical protein D3C87_1820800 [compost metagenome]